MTPEQIRSRLLPVLEAIHAAAGGWTLGVCSREAGLRAGLSLQLEHCSLLGGSIADFLALPLPAQGRLLVICGDRCSDGGADAVMEQVRGAVGADRCRFVVILPLEVEQDRLVRIWRSGPDGLVARQASGEGQLLRAVLAVLQGQSVLDPALQHRLRQLPHHGDGALDAEALSGRERELLLAVARGYSSSQIAVLQHTRSDSVRRSLSALYRKVGVRDQRALVAWGLEQGLLRPLDLHPLPRATAHPARGSRHRSHPAGH